jgi:hypothetical protein
MVPQEVLRQQREIEPKDSLDDYAGEWVILRDGHVVANAREIGQLLGQDFRDGDAVLHVTGSKSFLF